MNPLTRRSFGKRILAASALPLLKYPIMEQQTPAPGADVPDVIAGYRLTQENKQLAAKFLSTHEKNIAPLREKDLPNSLAPNFFFASPRIGENGEARK